MRNKDTSEPGQRPRRIGPVLLYLACAATLLPSLFLRSHAEFGFAEPPGFHAVLALATGLVFVVAAQLLRYGLMRPENYYGEAQDR